MKNTGSPPHFPGKENGRCGSVNISELLDRVEFYLERAAH